MMMLLAHLYIFGDSLSSPTGCEWARHLTDVYAIHNHAQAALTMHSMDMPSHLALRPHSTAVLWAGSNDAGSGVPAKVYEIRLREFIKRLKMRGANPILVVGLPYSKAYNKIAKQVAFSEKVRFLPMSWRESDTQDGVHPTCEYNRTIANRIHGALEALEDKS